MYNFYNNVTFAVLNKNFVIRFYVKSFIDVKIILRLKF